MRVPCAAVNAIRPIKIGASGTLFVNASTPASNAKTIKTHAPIHHASGGMPGEAPAKTFMTASKLESKNNIGHGTQCESASPTVAGSVIQMTNFCESLDGL